MAGASLSTGPGVSAAVCRAESLSGLPPALLGCRRCSPPLSCSWSPTCASGTTAWRFWTKFTSIWCSLVGRAPDPSSKLALPSPCMAARLGLCGLLPVGSSGCFMLPACTRTPASPRSAASARAHLERRPAPCSLLSPARRRRGPHQPAQPAGHGKPLPAHRFRRQDVFFYRLEGEGVGVRFWLWFRDPPAPSGMGRSRRCTSSRPSTCSHQPLQPTAAVPLPWAPLVQVGWLSGPADMIKAVAQAHQFITFTVPSSLQASCWHRFGYV